MSEFKLDPKPQSRFRLAPLTESTGPKFPKPGPVDIKAYLQPSEGGIALQPLLEPAVAFARSVTIDTIKNLELATSGFDESLANVQAAEDAHLFDEPTPPPVITAPVAITFKLAAPAAAKITQGFGAISAGEFEIAPPRMTASTLRPKLILGPNPNAKAPEPPKVEAKVVEPPKVEAKVEPPKPAQAAAAAATVSAPPQPAKPQAPVVRPAAPAAPKVTPPPPKVEAKPAPKPEPPKPVVTKPAPAPEPPKPVVSKPAPAPEPVKPKVDVKPAAPLPEPPKPVVRPAPPVAPSRPAMAARDRGNAVPVEREQPEVSIPAPTPKPKLVPINKPSETLAPAAAADTSNLMDGPMLGMPSDAHMGGFWSSASGAVKAAIVIGTVAVLGAGGTFVFKGGSPRPPVEEQATTGDAPGMIVGGGGWTTTWGQDTPLNKGKQISLYRPSMAMSDYRFEFRGQIEKKALGWIFRAKDTKNYYVAKLEVIKPGLSPVVALVKYPVINGKEGTHTQVMLPMEVKADTVYKVRLDVRGNKFTTYVQDKLVDYWTDDQIKQGGTGFYGDKGELAQIKSSTVYYLK